MCDTGKTLLLPVWFLPSLYSGIKLHTRKINFLSLVAQYAIYISFEYVNTIFFSLELTLLVYVSLSDILSPNIASSSSQNFDIIMTSFPCFTRLTQTKSLYTFSFQQIPKRNSSRNRRVPEFVS